MDFYSMSKELVEKMSLEEKISQMRYDAPAIERLGIPAYNWWNECLHGLARNGTATVFPQAIAMAATFNKKLMYKVASAISDETRARYNENKKQGFTDIYQGLTMCSPNINIFRDPRWGRGHETYGEDPVLTGLMATAYVKGLQGNGKYRKVDATLKHYAVHSGPEADRHGFNVVVSEKDLFETYLKAFEICIKEANPSAVMGAYNAVNGEPCTASNRLLNEILRNKFGFKGYIESDAAGVEDIHLYHKLTTDSAESAAMAVNNGCDMCIGDAYRYIPEACDRGLIEEKRINEAVTRLFETRFRLGMFADDCEFDDIPYEVIDCKEHKKLNLQMSKESIVLLKNNGILPLDPNKKIAVIGPNADEKSVLFANYYGNASDYYTFLRGIKEYAENCIYAYGCKHWMEPTRWGEKRANEAIIAAEKSDVVVMFMGLCPDMEGEQPDNYSGSVGGDKASIELPKVQKDLYEQILKLGKPIVFVNVSGSCVSLEKQKHSADAIIQCFYPGAMGGRALAEILFGYDSPSGRLPVTFYASDSDLPDFNNYSMENRTYKFFKGNPTYEFGYGLTYSDISEEWLNKNEVLLKNNGNFDTCYTVLKFENIPYKSLEDFKKIFIKKGESKKILFDK